MSERLKEDPNPSHSTKISKIREELQYLTNDAQSLLGSGDAHIYLVGIVHEAQMFGQPTAIGFSHNLLTWQRAHCRYDDVIPFTS